MQFFCVPYERTLQTVGKYLKPTQSLEKHLQSKKVCFTEPTISSGCKIPHLRETYYFERQVSVNLIFF